MRDRPSPASRSAARPATISIDLAVLSPRGGALAALLTKAADARARERWCLPWDVLRGEESLSDAASRMVKELFGQPTHAVDQIRAFGDNQRHPGDADLSVGFMVLVPSDAGAALGADYSWFAVDRLPTLPGRQHTILDAAIEMVRSRLDQSPVAFRLLTPTFTLSELQGIYELLLGRRLHKASFRRALHAAGLVEPTDELRSEGRGRPAQLFRYAPKKRRGTRRGVRFDLLPG